MMSPYQYAANNPILYIDVNGDSLWVNYFDANNQQQSVYHGHTKQHGYGFYNKGGSLYSGGDNFIKKVSGALGQLVTEKNRLTIVA